MAEKYSRLVVKAQNYRKQYGRHGSSQETSLPGGCVWFENQYCLIFFFNLPNWQRKVKHKSTLTPKLPFREKH